jgi:hypothetical protein
MGEDDRNPEKISQYCGQMKAGPRSKNEDHLLKPCEINYLAASCEVWNGIVAGFEVF